MTSILRSIFLQKLRRYANYRANLLGGILYEGDKKANETNSSPVMAWQ